MQRPLVYFGLYPDLFVLFVFAVAYDLKTEVLKSFLDALDAQNDAMEGALDSSQWQGRCVQKKSNRVRTMDAFSSEPVHVIVVVLVCILCQQGLRPLLCARFHILRIDIE